MKRAIILLVALSMLFSLSVCGSAAAEDAAPVEAEAAAPAKTEYSSDSLDQAIRDAESGNTDAILFLANLYYLGDYNHGISRDLSKALEWFLKAGDAVDARDMYNIAKLYERGAAGEKSLEKAYEWYAKSAAAGYAQAKEAMERDLFRLIRWKANSTHLKGQLGEREMIGTGYAMPYYLDLPVVDCDMITMDFRIVNVKNGWPYGRYALWGQAPNGKWFEIKRFQVEKSQQDGEPKSYEFPLDEPVSFVALAVCLSESGMEFGLVHDALYYVDSNCVSAYSESIPEPYFTPSDLEYPEISSTVSYSAFVNPYG